MRATKDSSGWNYGKSAKDALYEAMYEAWGLNPNETEQFDKTLNEAAQALYQQIIEIVPKKREFVDVEPVETARRLDDFTKGYNQAIDDFKKFLATFFGQEEV